MRLTPGPADSPMLPRFRRSASVRTSTHARSWGGTRGRDKGMLKRTSLQLPGAGDELSGCRALDDGARKSFHGIRIRGFGLPGIFASDHRPPPGRDGCTGLTGLSPTRRAPRTSRRGEIRGVRRPQVCQNVLSSNPEAKHAPEHGKGIRQPVPEASAGGAWDRGLAAPGAPALRRQKHRGASVHGTDYCRMVEEGT